LAAVTDDPSELLAQLAVERGLISSEQAREALEVMAKMEELGVPEELGKVLVKKGFISVAQLQKLEAKVTPKQPTNIGGFEILSRLGRGGMGAVYKARQVSMDRLVALKVLPPVLAKDKNFIERFFREARAVAKLNHPNIVQGIDVGVAEKYYYFAMEFVDGETVQKMLGRDGPMDEKVALNIVLQIAQALHHASRNDMIHRDVKPDNIMVTPSGVAKLCDLGLAKSLVGASSVTQTGLAVGTPHYISPEQARGEDDVDTRADIYSLGATLYHMVVGATPYSGSSAAVVMTKHLNDEVPNPREARPELSMGLVRLVEKMMAKDRADRYQTPEDVIKDIDMVLSGKSPGAMRLAAGRSAVRGRGAGGPRQRGTQFGTQRGTTRPVEAVKDRSGKNKLIALGAGVLVIAVLGIVLGIVLRDGGDTNGSGNGGGLPPPPNGGKTVPRKDPPLILNPREEMRRQRLAGLKADFEKICADWQSSPKTFGRIAGRLGRLERRGKGTEYVLKAQKKRGEVYDAQFRDAVARAKVMEEGNRLQEAYDVFNRLPLEPGISEKAEVQQRRIKAAASRRFGEIRKRAWRKLGPDPFTRSDRGDLPGAVRELRTALALKMQHVLDAVNAEVPKLRAEHGRRTAELKKSQEAKRAGKLKDLYVEFVEARDKCFAAAAVVSPETKLWNLQDALNSAKLRLLVSRFRPFEAEAKRVIRDLSTSAQFVAQLQASIGKKSGQIVSVYGPKLPKEEGTLVVVGRNIVGVRPKTLRRGSVGRPYTKLAVKCMAELAGMKPAQAGDAYLAGTLAFFIGRKSEAVELLKVAIKDPKFKADARYYLDFSLAAYKAEREKLAGELLAECRRDYRSYKAAKIEKGDQRWIALRDRLQKLKDEYADTDVVKRSLGK
jgi:eukaryotic-like serine/threonine-protein kinase